MNTMKSFHFSIKGMRKKDKKSTIKIFHDDLIKEIREDLSDIVSFEQKQGFGPYFYEYYKNFTGNSPNQIKRVENASISRRAPLVDFCIELQQKFGAEPEVLDVGCGFGTDAFFLAALGCRVVGVDPDSNKIAIARHRANYWNSRLEGAPIPKFLTGYLEDMDLEPNRFTAVYTSECLHHCEPVENILLKIRQSVRKNGTIFINEANATNIYMAFWRRFLYRGERRVLVADKERYRLYGRENIRTVGTWKRLFRECGFVVERIIFSRHLISEAFGLGPRIDGFLCKFPGTQIMAIHVGFQLNTVSILMK